MPAENWIDQVAKIFEIADGKGGTVRSFRAFEINEMPASITATMAPCVAHYIDECHPLIYGLGGPRVLFWRGHSEFHLTGDAKPANVPFLIPFFGRIVQAAMANLTLDGKVENFFIPDEQNAVQGFTWTKQDGTPDHQGIIVNWEVKETVNYKVSA